MKEWSWLGGFLLFPTLHIYVVGSGGLALGEGERRHVLFLSKLTIRDTAHLGWGTEASGHYCPTNPLKKDYCYLFYSTDPVLNKIQSYLIVESETQRG